MLENLHNYFVLFHFIDIILPEVISMNSNDFYQLAAELNVMDFTKSKPNYADLARKYGVDYRTVKKYHEGYKGKPRNREKPSRLDQYKELIIEKLSIPRISRKGVYEFLVDQYGIGEIGSYSNFKAYCKKHKLTPSKGDPSGGGGTRYETNPADMAQCDWKENMILTSRSGETYVVNIFHLVLKFSRYSYIELTLSKEQPIVFRCLINAFKFYGGVPKRILFDNMSTVINTNLKPKRVNHKMVQFAKDMNFRVESCKARHAYTKGTNEARNKIMDWLRSYCGEFDSIEELQEIVDKLNVKMNTNICQGTQMSPCLLFIKEKEYLTPLPDKAVLDGYLSPNKVKVSSQQLVYFNGVQYSVDRKYINEYVNVETFGDMLQIYYKGKLIQVHTISRNPINYTKQHYEQSIAKQFAGNEDFDKVVANNLSIMDELLDARRVILTKDDALKSYDHMIAYLVSQESLSAWIKRFIQTLNKEERKIFYTEVSKILPYITDEKQFFSALKKSANKKELKILRVNLWGFDFMDIYHFLSQEGYDSIYQEFEKETTDYLKTYKMEMEN